MKKRIVLTPYIVWSTIFIIIPTALVVFFAFTNEDKSLSFENINKAFCFATVFLRSVWLAAVATFFCFIVGYPAAYIISKTSPRWQKILITMVILPMWINFLLKTYAWMTILEDNGLINEFLSFLSLPRLSMMNTEGAVVLGMIYNFLAFMIFPIYSCLCKTDDNIVQAANDLGACKRKVFTKITLPLSMPGVISGIIMVFVPSVSTFMISRMLGGGKNLLIGDIIDMQFLGSVYNPNLGSAISLILLLFIFISIGILRKLDTFEERGEIAL